MPSSKNKKRNKIVLLTGASGFIGRHAIPCLLKRNYIVHAIAHRSKLRIIKNKQLIWHKCDLLQSEVREQLISQIKPSHLLHFAWYLDHKKYWTSAENLNWAQASICLLRHFAENGGRRVVCAGTCAEYDWNYGLCSEYLTPLNPATLYGICKNSLHLIFSKYASIAGLSYAWGRIFSVFGPYERQERLVPSVISSLLKNRIMRCTNGNQIRDYLHVEDVAAAFVALLDSDITGPVNIASGKPVALKDLVALIASKLKKKTLIRFTKQSSTKRNIQLLTASVNRLQNEVRWQNRFSLEQGLMHTITWWKKQDLNKRRRQSN